MDGSWRRVLIKRGPLEKAMANHFSFLGLRIVHEKCVKAAEWAGLILQAPQPGRQLGELHHPAEGAFCLFLRQVVDNLFLFPLDFTVCGGHKVRVYHLCVLL